MVTINADEFFKRGLGYLTKKDYEIMLFHELMKQSNFKGKSNYELSVLLKTTPAKIAGLKSDEVAYYNADSLIDKAKSDFLALVKQSRVMQDDHTIKLLIKDQNTMNYIVSLMNENFMLSDTSFNRNILKIDIEDYIVLLGILDDKTKELNDLLQKLNKSLPKNESCGWKDLLKGIVVAAAGGLLSKAGGKLAGKIVDLSFEGISNIIQQKINK